MTLNRTRCRFRFHENIDVLFRPIFLTGHDHAANYACLSSVLGHDNRKPVFSVRIFSQLLHYNFCFKKFIVYGITCEVGKKVDLFPRSTYFFLLLDLADDFFAFAFVAILVSFLCAIKHADFGIFVIWF